MQADADPSGTTDTPLHEFQRAARAFVHDVLDRPQGAVVPLWARQSRGVLLEKLKRWNEWVELRRRATQYTRHCSGSHDLELVPAAIKAVDDAVLNLLWAPEDELVRAVGRVQDADWALNELEQQCRLEQQAAAVHLDDRQFDSRSQRESGTTRTTAAAGDQDGERPRTKPKRSTTNGDARVKIIAALTKHHQYADDGCLNQAPIGNNELARQAGVAKSTAKAFFDKQFGGEDKKGGHAKYKVFCRNSGRLAESLKVLNGEFAPDELYGRRPPNEDGRDDDRDDD